MLIASPNAASINRSIDPSIPGAVKAAARGAVVAPGRPDAPDAAVRAGGDPAAVATDPADAGAATGFGRLLAQHMRPGDLESLVLPDDATARPTEGPPAGTDGLLRATIDSPPMATAGEPDGGSARIGFGAAVPQASLATIALGRPSGDDASPAPSDEVHDDAPANDLAAQLALVSQWAALATPASTPTAPASDADLPADGHDVDGKLDTVRAARQAPSPGGSAPSPTVDHAPLRQAEVAPLVAGTTLPVVDRNGRPAVGSTATAGTKPVAPKTASGVSVVPLADPTEGPTLVESALTTKIAVPVVDGGVKRNETVAADRLAILEAMPGKVDPAAVHGQTEIVNFATAFAAQVASPAANVAATATPAPTPIAIREPVGTPAWSHEVGQATLRLVASDLQQGASLRLNPEHLGPVDVQVRVDNGVAHLSFTAAHAETRQAIESSRTTLDQMFSDQGLKIGDCAVGDSSSSRKGFGAETMQGDRSQRDGGRWTGDARGGDTPAATVTTSIRKALGLVDTFA